jgi:hypothetical protein
MLNITLYSNITNISFSNSNSYLQLFYNQQLNGAYTDCKNKNKGDVCYATYRYSELPSGANSVSIGYKINYKNGNFYSSSLSSYINLTDAVKDVGYGTIESSTQLLASWTGPWGGSGCGGCDSCNYYLSGGCLYTVTWTKYNFQWSFDVSDYYWILIEPVLSYQLPPGQTELGAAFGVSVNVYIDNVLQTQKVTETICACSQVSSSGCVKGSVWGAGGQAFYKVSPGSHTIIMNISSGLPTEGCSHPMANISGKVRVHFFNKTNFMEVPYNGSFNALTDLYKYFNIDNKFDIAKNTYLFVTYQPTSTNHRGTVYTKINNQEGQIIYPSWPKSLPDYPTYTLSFTYSQSPYVTGNNNITSGFADCYYQDNTPSTSCSMNFLNGYLYIPKNDYRIEFINISNQSLPNLRGITTNTLWLGKNQTITYKITNIGNFSLNPTVSLFLPPHVLSNSQTISLGPNETKYVTFNITIDDLEPTRGFGLDSIWVVANSSIKDFGYNYTTFRTLPLKNVQTFLQVPDRVQAGGLFSIYTTFTPEDYSLFYPHVLANLDGTFGFENGKSSALMGTVTTVGACYPVTVTTEYNVQGMPTVNRNLYIYDPYGFFNKTKGNSTYSIGRIETGYGVLLLGDWDTFGIYDYYVQSLAAETSTIYSDWSLAKQYIYKKLDITEVPQAINVISGPDVPVSRVNNVFNWVVIGYSGTPTSNSVSYVPCLSSGDKPLEKPINVYVLFVKSGDDAFSLPAGEKLAVIDNQWVEPGQTAEGVTFKALAPLKPGIYNITVAVWDDSETGLYWSNTTEIRVIPALPGAGIVVTQKDEVQEIVEAKKPEENPKVLMKRIVYVTNKQGFDDYQVRWVANPLPSDGEYISGAMEGSIDFLANEETKNPSNITYYLPGVVGSSSSITYESRILPQGNATGKITVYAYNNASQRYYNVKVNATKFIPSGWSIIGDEIWSISLIEPYENKSKEFYLKSDLPIVKCYLTERTHTSITEGKWVDWREIVTCENTAGVDFNFSYPYPITTDAKSITINGTPTNYYYTDRAYIDIVGFINAGSTKVYEIEYSTSPVTIEILPTVYPNSFWVGEKANLTIVARISNWASLNISNITKRIPIPYGENLKVYKDSTLMDEVSLIRGYYELNISNISAYEIQTYTLNFSTPTATMKIGNERESISSAYHFFNLETSSLTWFPLNPLYINISQIFNCSEIKEIWEVSEENYQNPVSYKSKRTFTCQDNNTIINLAPLDVGETKYYVIFISGRIGCSIINKTITNAPLSAYENANWLWQIECGNPTDKPLNYSIDISLPLESTDVKLDGNPIEVKFLTTSPYGPYITLEKNLSAHTSTNYTLEFKTPAVLIDVSPPSFPEKFYVGEKASLVLNIKIKNWASTDVSSVKKQIEIRYGEDLKVYEEGKLVDSQDLVKGYYALTVENISAYEVRNYLISYKTPTTISNIANYGRKIINQTQYLFYPVEVRSITDFPLSPLYQVFNHTEPFSCKNVAFVWLSNEKEYLNPSQALEYLSFECNGNNTVVKLKDLSPGISEYYDIFVIEQAPTPVAPINEFIFNFFEALIRIIQSFINWVASFVRP